MDRFLVSRERQMRATLVMAGKKKNAICCLVCNQAFSTAAFSTLPRLLTEKHLADRYFVDAQQGRSSVGEIVFGRMSFGQLFFRLKDVERIRQALWKLTAFQGPDLKPRVTCSILAYSLRVQ